MSEKPPPSRKFLIDLPASTPAAVPKKVSSSRPSSLTTSPRTNPKAATAIAGKQARQEPQRRQQAPLQSTYCLPHADTQSLLATSKLLGLNVTEYESALKTPAGLNRCYEALVQELQRLRSYDEFPNEVLEQLGRAHLHQALKALESAYLQLRLRDCDDYGKEIEKRALKTASTQETGTALNSTTRTSSFANTQRRQQQQQQKQQQQKQQQQRAPFRKAATLRRGGLLSSTQPTQAQAEEPFESLNPIHRKLGKSDIDTPTVFSLPSLETSLKEAQSEAQKAFSESREPISSALSLKLEVASVLQTAEGDVSQDMLQRFGRLVVDSYATITADTHTNAGLIHTIQALGSMIESLSSSAPSTVSTPSSLALTSSSSVSPPFASVPHPQTSSKGVHSQLRIQALNHTIDPLIDFTWLRWGAMPPLVMKHGSEHRRVLCIDSVGEWVICGYETGELQVWRHSAGRMYLTHAPFRAHKDSILCIAAVEADHDHIAIVSGGEDKVVVVTEVHLSPTPPPSSDDRLSDARGETKSARSSSISITAMPLANDTVPPPKSSGLRNSTVPEEDEDDNREEEEEDDDDEEEDEEEDDDDENDNDEDEGDGDDDDDDDDDEDGDDGDDELGTASEKDGSPQKYLIPTKVSTQQEHLGWVRCVTPLHPVTTSGVREPMVPAADSQKPRCHPHTNTGGQLVLTGGGDSCVCLWRWDPASAKKLTFLSRCKPHAHWVSSLSWCSCPSSVLAPPTHSSSSSSSSSNSMPHGKQDSSQTEEGGPVAKFTHVAASCSQDSSFVIHGVTSSGIIHALHRVESTSMTWLVGCLWLEDKLVAASIGGEVMMWAVDASQWADEEELLRRQQPTQHSTEKNAEQKHVDDARSMVGLGEHYQPSYATRRRSSAAVTGLLASSTGSFGTQLVPDQGVKASELMRFESRKGKILKIQPMHDAVLACTDEGVLLCLKPNVQRQKFEQMPTIEPFRPKEGERGAYVPVSDINLNVDMGLFFVQDHLKFFVI